MKCCSIIKSVYVVSNFCDELLFQFTIKNHMSFICIAKYWSWFFIFCWRRSSIFFSWNVNWILKSLSQLICIVKHEKHVCLVNTVPLNVTWMFVLHVDFVTQLEKHFFSVKLNRITIDTQHHEIDGPRVGIFLYLWLRKHRPSRCLSWLSHILWTILGEFTLH